MAREPEPRPTRGRRGRSTDAPDTGASSHEKAGTGSVGSSAPSLVAGTAPASPSSRAPRSAREQASAERRSQILQAAFDVFAQAGFRQAKLDDIARRAGIAKGTIYLYFPDKETLFVELLREAARPVLGAMHMLAADQDQPADETIRRIHAVFVEQILRTDRKHLLRLMMQEGPRFPAVAEFFYRDIVQHGLKVIRALGARGLETGRFRSDAIERFPQLVMAPLLLSVVWDSMFERLEHLDVDGMLSAYRDLLTDGTTEKDGGS